MHLANLHFALGIAHHARGQFALAFTNFQKGNIIRRRLDPAEHTIISEQVSRYLDALPDLAIPSKAARQGQAGQNLAAPIFIIGMPRSGSTLVERILGSHSAVDPLGELSIVPHMVERLAREAQTEAVDRKICALPDLHLAQLGEWYRARSAEHRNPATQAQFYTDKMHMNWRYLPLILRMLPDAQIIDVRRGAMDCCWSNYRTLFARGHSAASSLSDIAAFYSQYVQLSDAIRDKVPERVQLVRYEDLVADFGGVTGAMFASLGLDLEPQVADFHHSTAPVATASSEQVRRPLNSDGIGVWRAYEQWLEPLKSALGPLANG